MQLDDLNPAQRAAVGHTDGPLLVVAGAGTGKTQVITQRIAQLIKAKRAKAEEILALTFTEKAAGEMLDRLDGLIGWEAYRVNVLTFNAFGWQILQRFGHHIGRAITGEVLPEMAKSLLIKQHLSEITLHYYGREGNLIELATRMVAQIEALQNGGVSVARYRSYVEALNPKAQHRLDIQEARDQLAVYELYEQLKRRFGLIDYNDQITLPLQLLAERPNVAERLRGEYRYVLVDEYQDTNAGQDELLRLLVPPGGNIFAVGDDDQAIYGFRGARLGNILDFASHFGVKKPLVLTENYRSTQEILDAARRLIVHNDPERLEAKLGLDKRLVSERHGPEPVFRSYPDAMTEYETVTADLAARLKAGSAPESLAVLATSHRVLRALGRSLGRAGLPYRLVSSVNIFEQREVLQLWHLLRWIGLASDDESIMHLLHGPFVGWQSGKVRTAVELGRQRLVGTEAAIEALATKDRAASKLMEQLSQWRAWAAELPVGQLAYRLVFESGLGQAWAKQAEAVPRMVRVFEDLQLWFRQLQQYEQVASDPSLAGYLGDFPRPPEIEAQDVVGSDDGISLLTIHASKGLEFETVYLVGTTAEAWGEQRLGTTAELPKELVVADLTLPPEHERRRLLYVAMTRAKRELVISAPVLQAGGRPRRANSLVAEIFGEVGPIPLPAMRPNRLTKSLEQLERFAPPSMIWAGERLPFETADGWLELSTSEINQYDNCPYEFYLERVLKIRTPFGPPMVFGSLLHNLFRDYYQAELAGDRLTLGQLSERLDLAWSDRGYRSAEEAVASRQLAEETLASFYRREQKLKRRVRSSEEAFRLNLEEAKLRLSGRIDASFWDGEAIEVRDFKTGRHRDPEKIAAEAKRSLQLRTYALAIEQIEGRPPATVTLDYVVTGIEGSAELSATILKNHRAKLATMADQIRRRRFAPNPDPFHNCASYRYWGTGDDDET